VRQRKDGPLINVGCWPKSGSPTETKLDVPEKSTRLATGLFVRKVDILSGAQKCPLMT